MYSFSNVFYSAPYNPVLFAIEIKSLIDFNLHEKFVIS